jgi:hypothetical protein
MALEIATERHPSKPSVHEATPLEVFNIPLFEIPPMLDVRSEQDFCNSHILCAVSVPCEDGLDKENLFRRILEHDDSWGWCLQFPFVIVYDEATSERAQWLLNVLTEAVVDRTDVEDFQGADRSEQLLRRLGFQCRSILLLSHDRFSESFDFCCTSGKEWKAASFFEGFGPLPRCALSQPRVFLAGRQVRLTQDLLKLLGVSHIVVNADYWDIVDGTSGGGDHMKPFQDRHNDVAGMRYLKCEIPDREDHEDMMQVLQGTADFLQCCAAQGGVALICVQGQSRSAAVVCAYLMLSHSKSVQDAYATFQEAHIQIDPNLVWWNALRRLGERLRNCAIEDAA